MVYVGITKEMLKEAVLKKFKRVILIGSISFLIALGCDHLGVFQFLEYRSFDYRAQYSERYTQHHPDIVLILIDEPSLYVMDPLVGRWPWPRSIYAELISFLHRAGARLQGVDILFTESQKEALQSGALSDDAQLAIATAHSGPVVHSFKLSTLSNNRDEKKEDSFLPMMPEIMGRHSVQGQFKNAYIKSTTDYFLPFNDLVSGAAGLGFVDVVADLDGRVRSVDLFRQYQGAIFASLPLRMAIHAVHGIHYGGGGDAAFFYGSYSYGSNEVCSGGVFVTFN